MHITKTNAYLAGAAFIASLLLGGIIVRDRSDSVGFGDRTRALLDDAVISVVSLPSGAALLGDDLRPGVILAAPAPLWRDRTNGLTLDSDGTWHRDRYQGRWFFAGSSVMYLFEPDGRVWRSSYRWNADDSFTAITSVTWFPGRPKRWIETFARVRGEEPRV